MPPRTPQPDETPADWSQAPRATGPRGNPSPTPPAALARDGEWRAADSTWRCGDKDSAGHLHGLQCYYRQDGTLRAEYHYQHGQLHGRFRRYHPDGALAREGEYSSGNSAGEEVAYGSKAATDEPLRRCCVPPGAHKLVIRYADEGVKSEAFLDEQGRALLQDGSLHPERPTSVTPDARYIPEGEHWESGRYRAGQREGVWRWWSKAGEPREVAEYAEDQFHGSRQLYDAGRLVASWTYHRGTLHGSGYSRVSAGTYADERITWQHGEFTNGVSCGVWRYLNEEGGLLYEVDLGPGIAALPPDDSVLVATPPSPPEALDPARGWMLRLRQLAAASSCCETEPATACQVPSDTRAPPALSRHASQRWIEVSRKTQGDVSAVLAKLLEALMRGTAPSLVLREMACYLLGHPSAGLALVEASLAFEPQALQAQATRVLLLVELGQPETARRLLAELHPRLGPEAATLQALLDITFPRFDYLPKLIDLDSRIIEQLPDHAVADTERLHRAIGKAAMRLDLVRHALQARLEELGQSRNVSWLPPDVSSLSSPPFAQNAENASTSSALTLESYAFEAQFAGESPQHPPSVDTVLVDETLQLDGCGIGELMRQARTEWSSLCWLCFSAGLGQIALPREARSPQSFAQALATAFGRHHLLQDQLRTGGLRSRMLGAADFEWEGLSVRGLSNTLLKQAHDEYLEMRAVLFFAADDSCRSPWQDDLRA